MRSLKIGAVPSGGDQINIALYQAQKWIAERDP